MKTLRIHILSKLPLLLLTATNKATIPQNHNPFFQLLLIILPQITHRTISNRTVTPAIIVKFATTKLMTLWSFLVDTLSALNALALCNKNNPNVQCAWDASNRWLKLISENYENTKVIYLFYFFLFQLFLFLIKFINVGPLALLVIQIKPSLATSLIPGTPPQTPHSSCLQYLAEAKLF